MWRSGTWYLRNTNTTGAADLTFAYGLSTDRPIVGNWDGVSGDSIGVTRVEGGGLAWYLRNTNTTGGADIVLGYGLATDTPLVWR